LIRLFITRSDNLFSEVSRIESILQSISAIDREIQSLREERDSQNREAKEWMNKRNKVHERIRSLREEARSHRARRDDFNARVKELKSKLQGLRLAAREKSTSYVKLQDEVRRLRQLTPTTSNVAKETLEDLEWKIQTTPLSLGDEKALIEQVKELEKQLLIHKKADMNVRKLTEEKIRTEATRMAARKISGELTEKVEESRGSHEKAKDIFSSIDRLKEEADAYHQKVVEVKSKADETHRRLLEALNERRVLKEQLKKLRKEIDTDHMKKIDENREDMRRIAEEKLRSGAKLTLEELRLVFREDKERDS